MLDPDRLDFLFQRLQSILNRDLERVAAPVMRAGLQETQSGCPLFHWEHVGTANDRDGQR